MSSVNAVTQEIKISVRVASFYPIDTKEILKEVSELMAKHGQKQNFIVWRVCVNQNLQDFNGGSNEP